MRWFGEEKPVVEVWEDISEGPLDDIEAAEKIRSICRAAADSADFIGGQVGPAAGKPTSKKNHEVEAGRYQRAAKAAMGIAMKVSDDLMRDAAVREIVDLCLRANDLKTARILFRAIQAPSIRDGVLHEHPELRT
jgi:hypothetical protein